MNLENMLRETRHEKTAYCMNTFTWNVHNRQIHGDKAYLWLQGSRARREWGVTPTGYKVCFGGDETVVGIDSDNGCATLWIYRKPIISILLKGWILW